MAAPPQQPRRGWFSGWWGHSPATPVAANAPKTPTTDATAPGSAPTAAPAAAAPHLEATDSALENHMAPEDAQELQKVKDEFLRNKAMLVEAAEREKALVQQLEELKAKLAAHATLSVHDKGESANKARDLEQQVAAVRKECSDAQQQLKEHKVLLVRQEKELAAASQHAKTLENELAAAKQQAKTLLEQLDSAKAELQKLRSAPSTQPSYSGTPVYGA